MFIDIFIIVKKIPYIIKFITIVKLRKTTKSKNLKKTTKSKLFMSPQITKETFPNFQIFQTIKNHLKTAVYNNNQKVPKIIINSAVI